MVKDIVKQAVGIKMVCESFSPLISPAEVCYASGYALKLIQSSPDQIRKISTAVTVEEMNQLICPVLEQEKDAFTERPEDVRLFRLLLSNKVKGAVTEELKELFDMGCR